MPVLLAALVAVSLAAVGSEPLSCVCSRDYDAYDVGVGNHGAALRLHCLQTEDRSVSCTEDDTSFENAIDVQFPPASHSAKRSVSCEPDKTGVLRDYTHVKGVGLVRLFQVETRYADAVQRCRKEGGRLVNHHGYVQTKMLASIFPQKSTLTAAYTGVTYNRTRSRYYGSDGKSASDLPWAKGEPSRRFKEDCVVLDTKGGLRTVRCDTLAGFICERTSRAAHARDYAWVPAAGRFLKLPRDRRSYQDAKKACEQDGGALAVPDTWQSAEAMAAHLATRADKVYVGFTYNHREEDYFTPTGRNMSSVEFSNWESDNNKKKHRFSFDGCVTLHSGGYYDSADCRKKYNYLCELQP